MTLKKQSNLRAILDTAWVFLGSRHSRYRWKQNDIYQELLKSFPVAMDDHFIALMERYPIGREFTIEHDGFVGKVCGYYIRDDGKAGVNLQLNGAKVVHCYGEKWLC